MLLLPDLLGEAGPGAEGRVSPVAPLLSFEITETVQGPGLEQRGTPTPLLMGALSRVYCHVGPMRGRLAPHPWHCDQPRRGRGGQRLLGPRL